MIIPFKKTTLHIHPLFPGLVLFCFFSGRISVLMTVLALLLHETGHLLAMKLWGIAPRQISLTPFGGLIEMPEGAAMPPLPAFTTAAAGPLFSFLGCMMSSFLLRQGILSFENTLSFYRSNLLLCLFNLLPALPLDGGRMLQALLSALFRRKTFSRLLLIAGNIVALSLVGLSIYSAFQGEYQFAPGLAGLYVLYGCGLENRQSPYRYYSNLIARRTHPTGSPFPVQHLAVNGRMPLEQMLPRLKGHCYHLFHVLGEDGMEPIGQMNEGEFCRLLMESGSMTFLEALQNIKQS